MQAKYSFQLPESYGKLPQGMVWEEFVGRVGKNLGCKDVETDLFGTRLLVSKKVLIEGFGGVGNGYYDYFLKYLDKDVGDENFARAADQAVQQMRERRPAVLKVIKGKLYPYFC